MNKPRCKVCTRPLLEDEEQLERCFVCAHEAPAVERLTLADRIEWRYIRDERLGIAIGAARPTVAQLEAAEKEAWDHLKALKDQEKRR